MKKIIFILFIFTSLKAIGCSCGISTFSQQFINADLVAKIKVTNVSKEWNGKNDFEPYFIEFETIDIYKGNVKSNIIGLNNFYEMHLTLNSEWIIFAYSNINDECYNTNQCSGSKKIDTVFDENLYPNYNIQYKKSIDNLIKLLSSLKAKNININNKLNIINSCGYYNFLKSQQDLKIDKDYAFYKIILNSNFKIKKIIVIDGFNKKFDRRLKKEILENNGWLNVYGSNKKIPDNSEWLIIIKKNDDFTYDSIKYKEITYDP